MYHAAIDFSQKRNRMYTSCHNPRPQSIFQTKKYRLWKKHITSHFQSQNNSENILRMLPEKRG